jgi:hypothetical protein
MDEDAKVKAMLDNLKKGREALKAKRDAKKGITQSERPVEKSVTSVPVVTQVQEPVKPDRTTEKKERWNSLHSRLDKIETLLNKPRAETVEPVATVPAPVKSKAKPKPKKVVYEEEEEEDEPVVVQKKIPTQKPQQQYQQPQQRGYDNQPSQSDIIRRALLGNFY